MNTETVLAAIVPAVARLLKELVEAVAEAEEPPTLYDLEAQTQRLLPDLGHAVLQALVVGQGAGVIGAERACACGERQRYHDQRRPLTVETSVGVVCVEARARYRCPTCHASSYPLDEQLGLGLAGRMSRYEQEQIGWLLALLPVRRVRETLQRFGWPVGATSTIRDHGEALGAELEARLQAQLQAQAAGTVDAIRQAPEGERLYAAPDGVMYCTTTTDAKTGQAQWRELKVAAVYEVEAGTAAPEPVTSAEAARPRTARERIQHWLAQQAPEAEPVAADQAVRVTYVAETGPWERFGQRLWGELQARGLGRPVSDFVVVADGSAHIDAAIDQSLRGPAWDLVRILDLPHAQQHLWTLSKQLWGEGNRDGADWLQEVLRQLERGQVAALLARLETLARQRESSAPSQAEAVRQTAAYFQQRQAQVNYPRFVAAGYQIGSGLAESACKRFGTDRMKGTGMRWTIDGAQQVATLRMFLLSDRWEEVRAHCRAAAA